MSVNPSTTCCFVVVVVSKFEFPNLVTSASVNRLLLIVLLLWLLKEERLEFGVAKWPLLTTKPEGHGEFWLVESSSNSLLHGEIVLNLLSGLFLG